jgi:3-oxoacyl-[acyl-carrier protein] reductase
MNIENSSVVITGAARGLGLATARDLAAAGARLGLIDLDREALDRALADLPGHGHHGRTANVADEAEVDEVFAELDQALGGIDAVINNAGITRDGLLVKVKDGEVVDRMSLDKWQQVIDVNLTGVFLCGRAAASRMAERGNGGVIINIASISKAGNFGQTNYSATKAGVAAMAVTWARELSRYGIRAASVSPGFTRTELVASMPQKAIDRITDQIPADRLGEPAEMAATIRFILENDYINGRDFQVDGGLRL